VTGVPTENMSLPDPLGALLAAKTSTTSGLLVSVTYTVLSSAATLSGSTRTPPSVVNAPLVTDSPGLSGA
jgi:hypothetical protein